ncbi:MAG TPA: SIS domain-containing protein [Anaerolineales bacterium]|nr:SIS domain-containing protein [Anaerolineales bacterium]
MTNNPYILDILSQPQVLRTALEGFDPAPLEHLSAAIQRGDFDRIVLTGMGGSLYASYPAWLALANAGLPAMWVDTAELIHHVPGLITPRTLLWLFSQSGKSAEIVSALDFERLRRPEALLATVNDLDSPLAKATEKFDGPSARVSINAIVEKTVSTRTYTNTLAVGQLAALALLHGDVRSALSTLKQTANAMSDYLVHWEDRVAGLAKQIGFPRRLAILGRGASMSAVYTGSLILGEAAKYSATPFQAAEFRHGPLELVNPDLTVLLFAGPTETRDLNLRLFKDLRGYDAKAFWIGSGVDEWQIDLPEVPAVGMPLMEILPMQLLSIHFARQIGVEPGHFFRTGKITLAE